MMNRLRSNPAFTLIETLISITLTTVVITAVTGLILTTLFANQRNLHSLQAMYLAQESLEAVRFMRDSNWLQNYSWNGDGGTNGWGADFDVSDLSLGDEMELQLSEEENCPPCFSFTTSPEEATVTADNGFEYLRTLTFKPVPDESTQDDMDVLAGVVEVTATVSWSEHALPRSIELSTYLTNWQ